MARDQSSSTSGSVWRSPVGAARRAAVMICCAVGAAMAASDASALSVRNCTDVQVRVNVYANDDVLQLVPADGAVLGAGETATVGPSGGSVAVKVFETGVFDTIRLTVSNVDAGGTFVIRDAGGDAFALAPGGGC